MNQATITAHTLHHLDTATEVLSNLRLGLDYHTGADLSPAEMIEEAAALTWAADSLLHLTVAQQRLTGTTWSEIGQALDITKQAAQQRFGTMA
jgi:hypothetical protein